MAYSWRSQDVLGLLNIRYNSNRTEIQFDCPVCGKKKFAFNLDKGIGHCWSCRTNADSAKLYATVMNMSLDAARRDIEARLGITNNFNEPIKREPRTVYDTSAESIEAKKADDETLDQTYRAFLSELTLSEKNKAMLLARGFSEKEIQSRNYRTFPNRSEINFFDLCKRLQRQGYTLEGVPGFFKAKTGEYTFIQLTKGIIMPQVNYKDQVVGLQIRKDDDLRSYIEEFGDYEAKCAWFSSKNRVGGVGANANVHYACDFSFNKEKGEWTPVFNDGFVLTEGIMKADLVHALMPNLPVIAVPGVHALNGLKTELLRLKELGAKTILLSYDMDYKTNENVQDALIRTRNLIEDCGLRCKNNEWKTEITVNGEKKSLLKGLDDYLAYVKYSIIPNVVKKESI